MTTNGLRLYIKHICKAGCDMREIVGHDKQAQNRIINVRWLTVCLIWPREVRNSYDKFHVARAATITVLVHGSCNF